MNINDIAKLGEVEISDGDLLQAMLNIQMDLEEEYGPIEEASGFNHQGLDVDIDSPQAQWYIKDAVYRIVEELSEFTNTLKNKPWKQTQVATDRQHMLEELSDAWHFMLRLFLILGLDAEDVYRIYFLKSRVNKFRQESKY